MHQISAASKAFLAKFKNHRSQIYVLNPENYCIPHKQRLLSQTTTQPLSNFEPQKPYQ